MLRVVLVFFVSLAFCILVKAKVASLASNDAINTNINEAFQNYLKSVAENPDLDVAIIVTREKHYDDGTLKQVDTIGFSSDRETDQFNISSISQKNIEDIVTHAEDKGVLVSLFQERYFDDDSNSTDFHTTQVKTPETVAATIADMGQDEYQTGLFLEVADTLDMSVTSGTLQFLEYFENGKIKRNRTTTVYPKKVIIERVEKMSARMQQTAEGLMKKAYKIDVDERAPIIATLFDKKFPKYYWQVLVNSTHYWIDDNDMQINLRVGADSYDILGIKNKDREAATD